MFGTRLFELIKVALAFIVVVAVFSHVFSHPAKPISTNILSDTYDSVVKSLMELIGPDAVPGDGGIPAGVATIATDNPGATASDNTAVLSAEATPSTTPGPTASPRPEAISINVAGGGVHKAGEVLRLYGENTVSGTVYLFVRGLGVPFAGASPGDLHKPVSDQRPETFTAVKVDADGAWRYNWTPARDQWTLTFRIFDVIAEAEPRDSYHLDATSKWAMASVKIDTT